MTVGDIICSRRKELGLTLEEVGNATGVSKSTVKKWENGFITNMRKDKIESLAKILNIDPLILIQGIPKYGKQLNAARKKYGLTLAQVSKRSNISEGTLLKYENDVWEPSMEELSSIADAYGISRGDLLWSSFEKPTTLEPNATMLPDSNVRMIPVYESVSAGFGAHAENMIVDYMPLYIVSAAEAENTLIIRVEGDSMYPKIEDGDSIQVLRQDFAENGQVAVLLIDGEDAVVKQFFHDPDAKTVTLHSFNPDYKDRVFEGIEITKLRILGVVRRVIKDI